jgi:RHS repeat-associated protein
MSISTAASGVLGRMAFAVSLALALSVVSAIPPAIAAAPQMNLHPVKSVPGTSATPNKKPATTAPSLPTAAALPPSGTFSVSTPVGTVADPVKTRNLRGDIDGVVNGPWQALGTSGINVAAAAAATDTANSGSPSGVTTQILSAKDEKKYGVTGLAFEFTRSSDSTSKSQIAVQIPQKYLVDQFGANYASRVTWRQFDPTAKPSPKSESSVSSQSDSSSTVLTPKLATASVVMAAMASPTAANGTGSFAATPLNPAGSWDVSAQTGDFNWAMPLRTPPAAAGPSPSSLALDYDSQAVDGQTGGTNNQSSPVGEGWSLAGGGNIQRQYVACSQDTVPVASSQDLCWSTDNATLTLDGHSSELVLDNATQTWKLLKDDGTKVTRINSSTPGGDPCSSNADNDHECWLVTTTDGTKYYFGLNELPGWVAGNPVTNSTWTVPVYGNDAGEPCNSTTFAASSCVQAWQWNLDYVVDVHNNAESLYYYAETNKYDQNGSTSTVPTYTRGGAIKEIDYGIAGNAPYATNAASDKVLYTYNANGRCSTSCSSEPIGTNPAVAPTTPANYPDVPWDQNCSAATCPNQVSPSFWSDAALATISTQAWQSGSSAYATVDTWTLNHTFTPAVTGDATSASLWLASVAHQGTSSAVTEPPTTFTSIPLQHRVWSSGSLYTPLDEFRISSISTSLGAQIVVNYSAQQCTTAMEAGILASPQTNQYRCFPSYWSPPGSAPIADLFHKYVVTSMVSNPETGGGADASLETDYDYSQGHPAWRYNSAAGTPKAYRTWSDFAGYDKVVVDVGAASAPTLQQSTSYTFFQGMNGDALNSSGSSLRTAYVDGTTVLDQPWLAGRTYQSQSFSGSQSGAALLSTTVTTPWVYGPTATPLSPTGAPQRQAAYMTGDQQSITTEPTSSGGSRTVTTSTVHSTDGYGLVLSIEKASSDAGTTCTSMSYATPNTTAWLIGLPSEASSVAVPCASLSSAVYPHDAISDTKTVYDGLAVGASPTKGDPTTIKKVDGYMGSTAGTATWATFSQITYDALGRATTKTDVLGHTTTNAYTPTLSGPLTSQTTTNTSPFSWTTTTTYNPNWGSPLTVTDANGKVTSSAYDGLGRITGIWKTDRPQSSNPTSPSIGYTYTLPSTAANAVETSVVGPGTLLNTYALYDGLGRAVQSQTRAEGGGSDISDSAYDSAGHVFRTNNPYWTTSVSPSTSLFVPTSESAIPSETVAQYDGAGRVTSSTLYSYGAVRSTTSTSFEGSDEVDVTPPAGGTPETTFTNSLGQKTKLLQYLASTPTTSATTESTTYGYNVQGSMTSMTDPAGNLWTWQFNVLGQKISATDPDTGTSTTTYDEAGDVLTTQDARGVVLAYSYDALQRKTAEYKGAAGSGGTELAAWSYDPTGDRGQLASSTRYVGSTVGTPGAAYTSTITGYDAGYRPTGQTLSIPAGAPAFGGTSFTQTQTYNGAGLPVNTGYPAEGGLPAETVKTLYDGIGNASGLGSATANYDSTIFNPLGQIEVQSRAGSSGLTTVDTAYGYDAATNNALEIKSTTTLGTTAHTAEDNNYAYDAAGEVTSIAMTSDTLTSDTQCFAYDHLQDLTNAWTPADKNCASGPSATNLGGAAPYWDSYTIDPATGNRTLETLHGAGAAGADINDNYLYPPSGTANPHAVQTVQQTVGSSVSNTSYGYDAAGNQNSRPGQTVTYDAEGKVSTIGDGTNSESNIYDASGNLLLRTDSTTGTTLFNGATELHVAIGSSTASATRIYSANGVPVAERTTKTGVSGNKLTWLVADAQGTTNLEVDAVSGTLTYRAQDPYGNPRGTVPTWTDDRGYLDAPTSSFSGLTQLGARLYDPSIGKFLSVDPVLDTANPQQNNGYAYGRNSPIDLSDPSGLTPKNPCDIPGNECGKYAPNTGSGSSGKSGGGSGGSKGSGSSAPPAAGQSFTQWLTYEGGRPLGELYQQHKIPAWLLNVWGYTQDKDGIIRSEANPWQLYWGYRKFYDVVFKLGAPNQPESFPFQVGNKSYVIWAWVGNYPAVGDGGEVSVYSQNAPLAKAGPVWHADPGDRDLPLLSESVSDNGVLVASAAPSRPQPWVTSWNPAVQDRNVNDLQFTATVTFPNAGMYTAFRSSVAGDSIWSFPSGTHTAILSYTG